jgi:hypothetical protein
MVASTGKALAGKNQNAVAGFESPQRHNGLHTVHNAAGSHGPQA